MHDCLVALGSNLGNRVAFLRQAVAEIKKHPQVSRVHSSQWYTTPPIGGPGSQGDFLNGAVRFTTSLSPQQVLQLLQRIEKTLQRQRKIHWGPRTVDLDLLLYDHIICASAQLSIPHPRMIYRRFVLAPAVEIAAEMIHPLTGWTIQQLFNHLVRQPHYIAITGTIGVGKTELMHSVAQKIPGHLVHDVISSNTLHTYYSSPMDSAWETENKLLNQRSSALCHQGLVDGTQLILSDFWWEQSLAYANLWMPDDALTRLESTMRAQRGKVLSPTLVILLHAPTSILRERIRIRNRSCEKTLSIDWLTSLTHALRNRARELGTGPVIELDITSPQITAEVTAAVQAIYTPVVPASRVKS